MVDWKLRLPRGDKRLVAYGDLNCPFCFALEERLLAMAVDALVEWRLVEHAPDLPYSGDFATPDQLEELGQEIEALEKRAPEVEIELPRFRSNSRRAIETVAEGSLVDPDKADVLRRSLFLALWREGRDIGSAELLVRLSKEAGLPIPTGKDRAKQEKQRWTQEWRSGGFDRIPVLISTHGATLEGLPTPERLELFLRSGIVSSSNDDVCDVQSGGSRYGASGGSS